MLDIRSVARKMTRQSSVSCIEKDQLVQTARYILEIIANIISEPLAKFSLSLSRVLDLYGP